MSDSPLTEIFVALWVSYHDDYKLRGEPPARFYGPETFASKKNAQDWLCKFMCEKIAGSYIDGRFISNNDLEAYFEPTEEGDSDFKLLDHLHDDYDVLTTILEADDFAVGEYVPRRFDYKLKRVTLCKLK